MLVILLVIFIHYKYFINFIVILIKVYLKYLFPRKHFVEKYVIKFIFYLKTNIYISYFTFNFNCFLSVLFC